jgi:hypothetical protein
MRPKGVHKVVLLWEEGPGSPDPVSDYSAESLAISESIIS